MKEGQPPPSTSTAAAAVGNGVSGHDAAPTTQQEQEQEQQSSSPLQALEAWFLEQGGVLNKVRPFSIYVHALETGADRTIDKPSTRPNQLIPHPQRPHINKQVHVAPISESEGCGLVARAAIQPGEVVLRVPLSCCMHVEAVTTPKSVLAPLTAAEADLLAALPDDEVLALLLMAERRAGPRSFWWPYLRWVSGWMDGVCVGRGGRRIPSGYKWD